MSLFLIYFELGKPVPPSPVPAPLQHFPVAVTIKGRSGPARAGLALTDGGSSAAFLAFGNKGLARKGDAVRCGLVQFVQRRLDMGAQPHFVFHWVEGSAKAVSVDTENVAHVAVTGIEDTLRALAGVPIADAPAVVYAIVGPDDGKQRRAYQLP